MSELPRSFGLPKVVQAAYSDTSPPLRTLKSKPSSSVKMGEVMERENFKLPRNSPPQFAAVDPVVQHYFGPLAMPAPILTFEGYKQQDNYNNNNNTGVLPPDTEGDIGPNHYFQWNNIGIRIFDRSGNTVYGPVNGNTMFTVTNTTNPAAAACAAQNDGDPIVLYDTMAGRWLASQFAVQNTGTGPSYECIAISKTDDPTGEYYRYAFLVSETLFEDYPHFGVWPEAYYMATNEFSSLVTFAGAGFYAFDREKMLAGDPTATMQYYHVDAPSGGFLPSDLDGPTPPPAGSPNFFLAADDEWQAAPADRLTMYKFHADFDTITNTTFVGPIVLATAPFDGDLCTAAREACIPQPNTTQRLEAISDRLMYRLAYRNFGTHESLVVNQTVDATGTGIAGVRWYELRSPNSSPYIHQQSTYAPDANHRWMGSMSQDRHGNMALGYSVSNGTDLFPTIRYTGRLVTDPLNEMSQGETTMYPGGGSQTHSSGRWGDYSMMGIDPVDDCTFWYTQEYMPVTSSAGWSTRIGAFKFPGCTETEPPTATPTSTATPTVIGGQTATPTLQPVEVLYNQYNNQSVIGSPSFNVTGTTFIQVADDFVVPSGESWQLTMVDVDGFYDPAATAPPATSVNLYFYTPSVVTSTLPGAPVLTVTNIIPVGGLPTGDFLVPLDPPVTLPAGTYWVSVQANMPSARWLWVDRLPPLSNSPAAFRQPANTNPACKEWNARQVCVGGSAPDTDQTFRLNGRRLVAEGAPTSTGTVSAVASGTPTVALPTNTATVALPSSTPLPTQTPGGPTATLEPTRTATIPIPTNTATVVIPTSTSTVAVATATRTATSLPSQTPAGPTTTSTSTTVVASTLTGTPVASSTRTATRTGTATLTVAATITPGGPSPTRTATATACPIEFQDVPPSTGEASFYPFVQCLACRGIVSGYPCGGTNPETGQQEPCGDNNKPYYRPSNQITRGQISKVVAGASGASGDPGPQKYEDVPPGSTFYQWINRLSNEGVMGGYPCGSPGEPCRNGNRPYFRPNANATRGQMSKIVSNAAGFDESAGGQSFEDLPPSTSPSSYYVYVERLFVRGIVGGYPCGGAGEECGDEARPYFRPNNPVTRGQAAKIAANTFFPQCANTTRP
jgi:hypothetical protein